MLRLPGRGNGSREALMMSFQIHLVHSAHRPGGVNTPFLHDILSISFGKAPTHNNSSPCRLFFTLQLSFLTDASISVSLCMCTFSSLTSWCLQWWISPRQRKHHLVLRFRNHTTHKGDSPGYTQHNSLLLLLSHRQASAPEICQLLHPRKGKRNLPSSLKKSHSSHTNSKGNRKKF